MSKLDLFKTKSWEKTVDFYADFADNNPGFDPIHRLVSQIAAAQYSWSLFPATSMVTLIIGQSAEFERRREVLEIDLLVGMQKFSFQYWEEPTGKKKKWEQICDVDEGFEIFERFVELKKWYT